MLAPGNDAVSNEVSKEEGNLQLETVLGWVPKVLCVLELVHCRWWLDIRRREINKEKRSKTW